MLMQSIAEHKPLVDKLTKTGEALMRLTNEEDAIKLQEILDSDNARYAALRSELRQRQQALEKALQVRVLCVLYLKIFFSITFYMMISRALVVIIPHPCNIILRPLKSVGDAILLKALLNQ